MSPITHFIGSWLVATVAANNPRDRKLVTLAGILPDADGLGLVADLTRSVVSGKECTFQYYQQYHHHLLHGWAGAVVIVAALSGFTEQRWRVAAWCLMTFHLHLACDLVGSRGPGIGDIWPIFYGEPLFRHPVFSWNGQWRLDGWQNRIITIVILLSELWIASRRGCSCVELFSRRGDRVFVEVLQKWRVGLRSNRSPD